MQGSIAAIDQGTTSTRCMIFNAQGTVVSTAQREHRQIYPRPGWVEHDANEIWSNTQQVVRAAVADTPGGAASIAAIGLTNQRETVVIWDRRTGQPCSNAIVWQDTRTDVLCARLGGDAGPDRFREKTGLPLSTYFSGPKIAWLLAHDESLRAAADRGELLCGTMECWLIWNLTGGPNDGAHVTDVTNASRTLLMNLHTLQWDDELLEAMDIPRDMLPRIVPTMDMAGWGRTTTDGPFGQQIPVCGAAGDQQAALIGQCCFEVGEAKNTYGTGCFALLNIGESPVQSKHGLLTTVAYKMGDEPAVYALEGSIAIAGALVQWLRDNLELIGSASEIESLAASVADNGGAYIVPAFSGLFAPHWRPDARGVIVGLTRYVTKAHLARAVLEATAFQTYDVLQAMQADSDTPLQHLQVDGGMVVNDLLMQIQADVLSVPVVRPRINETTALGAAYLAGLASSVYADVAALRGFWQADRTWTPAIEPKQRERMLREWQRAVERSLNWVEP